MLVEEDVFGLFIKNHGFVARPTSLTVFNKSDVVKAFHLTGSIHDVKRVRRSPEDSNVKEKWIGIMSIADYEQLRSHMLPEEFQDLLTILHQPVTDKESRQRWRRAERQMHRHLLEVREKK